MQDFDAQLTILKQQLKKLQLEQLQLQVSITELERQWNASGQSATPIMPAASETPAVPQTVLPRARNRTGKFSSGQSLEDFIGTNIISKVGILITIIGIFIGAKYAIDKDLVSPAVRMAGGYVAALLLVATGLWLKQKYTQFSAVLVGGGVAVVYFITYSAFGFYHLFSQPLAFVLMLVTTIAAVALACWYDQQVIALLGQVAAYAIPLLLSDGSGNILVLFTYTAVINAGILVLSFRREWKLLYRIAFIITWALYLFWVVTRDVKGTPLAAGLGFLTIQFITFYVTFLAYKIFRKALYERSEMIVLLANALLYFILGYAVTGHFFEEAGSLAAFTMLNAVFHFIVGYFIYKADLADKSVKEFIVGLGLLFLSIAIPVKLDGGWVTLLWSLEAVMLAVVAIRTNRRLYFDMAIPVMLVAVISLFHDLFWANALLWERYMAMTGIALACVALERSTRKLVVRSDVKSLLVLAFQLLLLVCICNEYLYWLTRSGARNQYKLGLSVIWGLYALAILFLGLTYDKKNWRIWAIFIFTCTILKLFIYDLSALSTIAKTIVMTFTGIILLVASFLYNKYKNVLMPKEPENEQGL
ncbi:DUF2339 domain-containing protein [Filimonas effusa]|uniref:DUF2339 domain-containing protein n=1 Tax=Filimonas effusa TaxID=2508721 RepID=A0A4Q1D1X7_9BACT|nr:DUF2339 domain-containing protein [Filimonas effusa]RXK81187.1 DUF2339 domain-containing protein [Filimonas effusa]